MKPSSAQTGRAAGVLVGQAIGDALGVPYEFAPGPAGEPRMIGGGLGPYQPGEWSDDTQMALCIARETAGGADLTTTEGLDRVAEAFLDWQQRGASDIGAQTSSVLRRSRTGSGPLSLRMAAAAHRAAADGRAGNGGLMRTGIVGLVALDDRERTALVAARVAALTHADERCVDSCVLWSEAVRLAVVEGELDVRAGVDLLPPSRRSAWLSLIDEAEAGPPTRFRKNGYTVTAFQAAWAAIHATRQVVGPDHVQAALSAAIAIGHDTDTVAAIAGTLLGARYGASGLPSDLLRRVHGWPGVSATDLIALALATAFGRQERRWPWAPTMIDGSAHRLAVPHPHDPKVILGTEADLAHSSHLGVTAAVSLSRLSSADAERARLAQGKHAQIWLIDSNDPAANSHLAWTLADAARTVRQMRDEGDTVLLHCVAAHHRTPSVALAYSRLLGVPADRAVRDLTRSLGVADIDGLLWQTALTL